LIEDIKMKNIDNSGRFMECPDCGGLMGVVQELDSCRFQCGCGRSIFISEDSQEASSEWRFTD